MVEDQTTPKNLMTIERREWGNFYGTLVNVKQDGKVIAEARPRGRSCRPGSTSSTPRPAAWGAW